MIHRLRSVSLGTVMRTFPVLLLLLATACASVSPAPSQKESIPSQNDYVFVFLKTGPVTDLSEERTEELQRGHFANMDRLWDQGLLLISGPFGDPRPDPENRGMFIFDVAEVAIAEDLTRSDPALQAGALRLVAFPFTTADPLRDVYRLDRADRDSDRPNIRPYVLAMSEDLEAAERLLAGEDFVVFSGRFGGDLDGTVLFALDANNPAAARVLLRMVDSQDTIEWQLHPWYGSPNLIELPPSDQ